jgi:ribosomal protein S18 acetylase RimI-like enzyme
VVTVRLATVADIDVLVDLMRDFYGESNFPLDAAWASQSFADLLAEPAAGAIWLIDVDGRPVGHVVLSIRYAMEYGGLIGYIDDLYVRPAHRRRGAASAGVAVLVAECQKRGCKSLHVEVDPNNAPAIGVYRRFGMAPGSDERLQLKANLPA